VIGGLNETSHSQGLTAFAIEPFRYRPIPGVRHLRGIATIWLGFAAIYRLETSSRLTVMEAQYRQDGIRILLPIEIARKWAGSDQISLSLNRADGGGPTLLIEKDFQCLHSDDADSFPNPLADDPGSETVK
jgi:hypothetical protein